MTGPRPDLELGQQTEYGNDTGFVTEAADPTDGDTGAGPDGGTGELTPEDGEPAGAPDDVAAATGPDGGPGDGAD